MTEQPRSGAASVAAAAVRTAVENLVNRVIRLDPEALERCARLAGKRVRLQVEGLDFELILGFGDDGVHLLDGPGPAPDTTIAGSPLALLGMVGGRGPDALFSGEVRMHGDTLVGKRLHRLFDELDIDWEEQVSRYTGDLVAHRLGLAWRDLGQWSRRSADSLARDLGEYLQEETELLANRAEVDSLVEDIERFAQDVDRLEARVKLRAAAR